MSSILAIPGQPITQGQIEALVASAKFKGFLAGNKVVTDKNWGSLLREIRYNICDQGKNTKVAGPWPVQGRASTYGVEFSSYGIDGDPTKAGPVGGVTSDSIDFYFASNSANHAITSTQRVLIANYNRESGQGQFEQTVKIIVGGNIPVRFQGGFAFYAFQADALTGIGGSVSTNFPGLNFSISPPTGFVGGSQSISSNVVDSMINPGVYTFTITISNAQGFNRVAVDGMGTFLSKTNGGAPRITTELGTASPYPALHGSLQTYKIKAEPAAPADPQNPDDPNDLLKGTGTGIYGWNRESQSYQKGGSYYEATTPGLWCVKTRMIRGMKNLCDYMPWNPLIQSGISKGLPTGELISEKRTQPATGVLISRANSTAVSGGNYIRENGAYFYALRNGTTASTKPQFGSGGVIDGTVAWIYMGDNLPVQSRIFASPCYPYQRLGGSLPDYQYWNAFSSPTTQPDFFIRNLRLTRLRSETASQVEINGELDPIPVRVGCMRNGSFVSFGTYNTGTLYTVFWPVFQTIPLVYDASENLSVSAEIGTIVEEAISGEIDFPILADHFNETARTMGIAI